jgi:hypothetical protein
LTPTKLMDNVQKAPLTSNDKKISDSNNIFY